jgi:tRNA/tmRNA/rRNA uracil-C5-methylase (TrmA/RlmC/RlmD family)
MKNFGLPQGCNPRCRGCSHRGFTKDQSLFQKQEFVKKTLKTWEHLVRPIVSVEEDLRWNYRTSVTLAAEWDGKKWLFGTKSMDEVIPIHNCPVHSQFVNKTIELLSPILPAFDKFPLAFIVMSKAQCTLILKQKPFFEFDWLTDLLRENLKHVGIDGFWIHFNPSSGRRLFGKGGWVKLFGNNYSLDSQGLVYGPTAFQQQISNLYLETLSRAEEFLKPNNNSAIVDLYCGTGTSLKRWDKHNVQSIGIESGAEAVECAKINAPKSLILRGMCRLRVPQMANWTEQMRTIEGREILLYANPPRTGVENDVLEWLVKSGKPQRIAYLSCSPGTLSKNLLYLTKNGYEVAEILPYDFFPQTHHVECLAFIARNNKQ